VVLLDEFEELLVEKFSFSVDAARAIRGELEAVVDVVEPEEIPEICRDPDDNQVLGAAATGGVEAIVTGDKDLLDLGSYEGIGIVQPAEFVRSLPDDGSAGKG
jgi:putative PIN family toxin of toxin-antitoxin system